VNCRRAGRVAPLFREREVRWQAAQEVTLSADAKMLPLLDKALAAETDPRDQGPPATRACAGESRLDRRRRPP
jgi:hypothetical protein